MSASDAALLVARFLKQNNYTQTLEAFVEEAGLPPTAGSIKKGDLTIEKILEEKLAYDVSVRFEKLGTEDSDHGWGHGAPAQANAIRGPTSPNVLHLSLIDAINRESQSLEALLITSLADRRLNVFDVPTCTLKDSLTAVHDSPILSCAVLRKKYLVTSSMSGQLVISDLSGRVLAQRRDHTKYVVQVAVDETEDATWVASASWDASLNLYKVEDDEFDIPVLKAPTSTVKLPTIPESFIIIRHPESGQPVLVLTRRDSTNLYYYSVDTGLRLLGTQNLAPHAISWNAFTPSAIALCPTDNTLIAVATSTIPHMKLLIARLLIPAVDPKTLTVPAAPAPGNLLDEADGSAPTAASQARAALILQDREAAAIQIHCSTLAPQTQYSTPALAWRPDGSGVWVNSDDGVIRGIEAESGKIVATLKGHDAGSKIRCLCAGWVEGEGQRQEWMVSGGFDQKLIVWKPEV